jgi:hypothetical protein
MTMPEVLSPRRESVGTAVLKTSILSCWHLLRFPLLAVLRLLDPVFRMMLSALGFLSIFMAFFFATVSRLPTRSLVVLLGFGVACTMAKILYERLLSRLSR